MAYQQYESFQTTLPPTVSAGWNDPPPMATSAPSTGAASRLTQMRRRPVDPSITGPSYGGHAPYGGQQTGYGAPMQQQQQAPQGYPGYPAQQAPAYGAPQQQQPQMQAYPGGQPSPAYPTSQPSYQQNQPMAAPITMQPGMQQGYGMPPPAVSAAYAPQVSPVVSQQGAALAQQGQAQFNPAANNAAAAYYPADPTGGAPQQTASMPSSQHRAIYDAFTVNNVPPAGVKTDPFLVRPQSSAPSVPIHTAATHAAWTGSSMSPSQSPYAATTTPVMTQPLEANPQSLIFAPPNAVGEAQPGQVPADPSMYNRVPVKAAGDVSLTGPQCVMFLMKATTRLPQAKCEGVQLRLNQLQELIQQGRLSEQCLKKLNFVVDAIDRGMLDDATAYFDQLQAQFPHELGAWGQGVRLLIGELRGPAGRVGSAGAHVRSQ